MKIATILLFFTFTCKLFAQSLPDKIENLYEELYQYKYEKKFKKLKKAIKKEPNEPWYLWLMADVYDQKGENDKAIEYFEKSILLDSNFSAGHGSLARFLRYNFAEDPVKMEKALVHINTAIRMDPSQLFYRIDRAYVYMALNKFDLAEAEADYAMKNKDNVFFEAEQLKVQILYKTERKVELKEFLKQHDLSVGGDIFSTDFTLLLASIYEENGDKMRACRLYKGASEPYLMMDLEMPDQLIEKLKLCK